MPNTLTYDQIANYRCDGVSEIKTAIRDSRSVTGDW
jgi:hypothetical protein